MAHTASPQTKNPQLIGVVGYFDDEEALIQATAKVKDAKYQHFDAFTPFPVHGLDAAQGIKRSSLPFVTFAAGLTGCSLGFLLEFWTSAVDWPINIGGKPFNSWPAFVPVMFECTILFAGLATAAGMFIFNGLPNIRRRIFDPRLTRDRFALVIEAPLYTDETDPKVLERLKHFKKFSETEASDFLKKAGAKEVKPAYAEGWF